MVEQKLPTGLELLRKPFEPHQISKLPKPTKKQTEEVRNDFRKGIRCPICGAWHHKDVVHLDYVGHAALTDRLLDCDPEWNWEPLATTETGTPLMDENGGMWIKLKVCGVTRIGYGHPDGKRGGDAIKEIIGDALRNAAMRFGAALDLWHKGDLHAHDDDANADAEASQQSQQPASQRQQRATPAQSAQDFQAPQQQAPQREPTSDDITAAVEHINAAENLDALKLNWADIPKHVKAHQSVMQVKEARKQALSKPPQDLATALNDDIPF